MTTNSDDSKRAFLSPSDAPKAVELSDITVRDGFQSLETIVSTDDKIRFLEDLILAGFKRVEVSNYSHPKLVPFFNDIDDVFKGLLNSEKVGHLLKQNKSAGEIESGDFVELTAITVTRKSFERALVSRDKGYGPDRILQMVSTCPTHHKRNSGTELEVFWGITEQCIKEAHEVGMLVNGTVSTIWGSPYKTFVPSLDRAVEFVKRYLELGADDIEHADHDGSLVDHEESHKYFSMILDPEVMGTDSRGRNLADPALHIAHFHTKSMAHGLRNVVGALKAGIIRFESTLTGIGGEPANKVDGEMITGRPEYYSDHFNHGLVATEDVVALMHHMGIVTGIDEEKLGGISEGIQVLLNSFNENQRNVGQPEMLSRSFIASEGKLPSRVTELIG